MTVRTLASLTITALLAGIGAAGAQDMSQPPAYGSIDLVSGFEPDPHTLQMQAGGEINASTLGNGCLGFIATAPDYRLNYTAGSYPLIFSVTASADTTLVVNDPNGNWHCDDDSNGNFDPRVHLASPASGQYDIWVGTYDSGAFQDATLAISEIASGGGSGGGGQTLDWNLPPNFGEVSLAAGFTPDPHEVSVTSGGPVDASMGADANCVGYVSSAPDFRLQFTAAAAPTPPPGGGGKPGGAAPTPMTSPLVFSVLSASDTTLVINGPDAQWHCNDDANGTNPQVVINQPASGQYDVWIGNYGDAAGRAAILTISEFY